MALWCFRLKCATVLPRSVLNVYIAAVSEVES